MMDTQLVLTQFLTRAEKYYGHKKIISRTSSTMTHRITYRDFAQRTRKLASALEGLGMKRGTKVGTFAWNHHRHLEAYFAIPCAGAIIHMLNIRLSLEHLRYIINHAEDEIILVDEELAPLLASIQHQLTTVKTFVVMGDHVDIAATKLQNAQSYEELLAAADSSYEFPTDLDENMNAGMCYTSATTGFPKGVFYTHRGIVLHSLSLGLVESFGLNERDIALSVVPMFHASAWGLPFAAVNFGSTQVLPGPNMTPQIILDVMEAEKVTVTAGVPTIWFGVLQLLENSTRPIDLSSIRILVSGGASSPKGLIQAFEQKYNIPFTVGYGLTETSPLVTLSRYKSEMDDWSEEQRLEARSMIGMPAALLQTKLLNEEGEVPWDGKTMGELLVKGPWIADAYYKDERTVEAFKDGWLHTGDIAIQTPEGFIKLVDRTKDLIKSGGEWISSVDLENALMTHDAVAEAAVIAMPHPTWQERPLACVVLKNKEVNSDDIKEQLLQYLAQNFAKWWVPDEIVFIDEVPKTSVGKFQKNQLRNQLEELLQ